MGTQSQMQNSKATAVLCEGAKRPHAFAFLFGVRYAHTGFDVLLLGLAVHSPSVSLRAGDKIGEKATTWSEATCCGGD